jgi:DNA-directed RNA polymerase specialized sigma24 family protein
MNTISNNTQPASIAPANTNSITDDDLVLRMRAGDRVAGDILYGRYAKKLRAVALRTLKDDVEAEDVVHDVFVAILTPGSKFNPARGHVGAWLTGIARNMAMKHDNQRLWPEEGDIKESAGPDPLDDVRFDSNGERS